MIKPTKSPVKYGRAKLKSKGKSLAQTLKERKVKRIVVETLSMYDEVIEEQIYNKAMPTRRLFRADYLCPNLNIMIELNGGQYVGGRHNRGGKQYEADLLKINMAQRFGFQVWQYTYEMIERGELLNDIKEYTAWKLSKEK